MTVTNAARHAAADITDEQLAAVYDLLDEQRRRLRAIRLVSEQLSRTADDLDPRRQSPGPTETGERLDVAEANAIRRCIAAVAGALQGTGREDAPPIPAPRAPGAEHDHAHGWGQQR